MKTIVPTEPTWDLWKGNALELLKKVPDNHFHTIVTSIPYWQPASQALRGMVGKEPTLKQYLGHCVLLARESKRVLRQDGTMWLNLHSGESAATIESDSHVISHSLPDEYRTKVAQAMSEVWSGHESPESSMQKLLAREAQEAAELCKTKLRKVRGKVHDSQVPDSQRSGQILFAHLRTFGQSNAKEKAGHSALPNLRQSDRTSSVRNRQGQAGFLQRRVLVRLQPKRQQRPLDGRTTRKNESSGSGLAQGSSAKRQASLQNLPLKTTSRSTSHSSVRNPQSAKVAGKQWDHSLSRVSPKDARKGVAGRKNTSVHGLNSPCALAQITFPKTSIPDGFMPFCEPEYVIKPKDDLGLHWRIALALQADGWYLRVPKSAIQSSDQGKHIFLFSKSAKYFYDRFAVRPIPKARPTESSWVSQCIRAATSEQGCCAGCGEQMIRMTQKLPARRYGPEGPTPAQVVTVGWKHPGCKCPTFDIVPCRVLDPFSGMGTTVMEAIRLGRSAVGIDISQDNIEMSRARILHDAPLFNYAKQARA